MDHQSEQQNESKSGGPISLFRDAASGRLPLVAAYWVVGLFPFAFGFFARLMSSSQPIAAVFALLWLVTAVLWAIGVFRCAKNSKSLLWSFFAKASAGLIILAIAAPLLSLPFMGKA